LLDYLTQLLGEDRNEQIRDLVDDVGRVQRGEILLENVDEIVSVTKQIAPNMEITVTYESKVRAAKKTAPPAPIPIPPLVKKELNRNKNISSKQQQRPTKDINGSDTVLQQQQPTRDVNGSDEVLQQHSQYIIQSKQPPPKGKASVVCGCFGTQHKALTNCLYCGRISCEREGYGFCAFCGYMVDEAKQSDSNGIESGEAWKQKERLLRYDREFAQRTVIFDDQADYYNETTSSWLNEVEQREASDRERERNNEIQKRKAMKLNLTET
jgi:Putative zinc finger motif, C2HC5-type